MSPKEAPGRRINRPEQSLLDIELAPFKGNILLAVFDWLGTLYHRYATYGLPEINKLRESGIATACITGKAPLSWLHEIGERKNRPNGIDFVNPFSLFGQIGFLDGALSIRSANAEGNASIGGFPVNLAEQPLTHEQTQAVVNRIQKIWQGKPKPHWIAAHPSYFGLETSRLKGNLPFHYVFLAKKGDRQISDRYPGQEITVVNDLEAFASILLQTGALRFTLQYKADLPNKIIKPLNEVGLGTRLRGSNRLHVQPPQVSKLNWVANLAKGTAEAMNRQGSSLELDELWKRTLYMGNGPEDADVLSHVGLPIVASNHTSPGSPLESALQNAHRKALVINPKDINRVLASIIV